MDVEFEPIAVYRLGKKLDRPRLLKVVLAASMQQRKILCSARKLKGSRRQVFIHPSLTYEQCQYDYQLRRKIKELRDAGKKFKIIGPFDERTIIDPETEKVRFGHRISSDTFSSQQTL